MNTRHPESVELPNAIGQPASASLSPVPDPRRIKRLFVHISKFRITLANTSVVALTAAAVTDILPAQITVSNPPHIVNTCGFSGVTADFGTSKLVLTGGGVPANTAPTQTVAGYQALENATTVRNTTPASATLEVRGLSPPTGVKSFTPPTINAGETSTLTLTNGGSDSILPVQVIDYVPIGVNLVGMSAPPTGWACNPATITPVAPLSGGNSLVCDKLTGVVTAGSTTTITPTALATTTNNVFNTATVTGDGTTPPATPDGSNCNGLATQNCDRTGITGIKPRIDLVKLVTLPPADETAPSNGLAQAGEKLTFTLTNSGDATLKPMELSDAQLDGSSLSCNTNATPSGAPFSLTVAANNQLIATDSVTCTGKHTVTIAEATAGRINNTATVVGYSPDALPKGTPWQSTATGLWVNTPPANQALKSQIELTKTAVHNDTLVVNGVFDEGETVTYGFIVRNVGPTALSNIVISDPLLAGAGSTITCLANTLEVNATTTCSVSSAYVLTAGQVANTAKVAATNTGAVALTNVTVSDTKLGVLPNTPVPAACIPTQGSTLASGAQMVCKGTYTVSNGENNPISNVATVTGQPADRSSPISATGNHVEPYIASISTNLYTIGNLVWRDANNNGVYNPGTGGDTGIDNVTVRLLRCDTNGANCVRAVNPNGETLTPDMLTAGCGLYRFSSIPETSVAGFYTTYKVQVLPANFLTDTSGQRALYGGSSSAYDAAGITSTYGPDQGFG